MKKRIYDIADLRFIKEAEENLSPRPLRRIFSLARQNYKCKSVLIQSTTFDSNSMCAGKCKRRKSSCEKYFEDLKNISVTFEKRVCTQYFFLDMTPDKADNNLSYSSSSVLGYCMVHRDRIRVNNKDKTIAYVSESVLGATFIDKSQIVINLQSYSIRIETVNITAVIHGFYFSQQNSLTNVCAHAALKMSLRHIREDITVGKINEIISTIASAATRKIKQTTTIPQYEIQEIIRTCSDNKLDSFIVQSSATDFSSFFNIIYMALESRLPVLLGFNINTGLHKSNIGHIVSVVGHTFTANLWSAYGGLYFSNKEKDIISSSYFTESFVINDDNIGPLYNLSVNALAAYMELSSRQNYFNHMFNVRGAQGAVHNITAIIIHPAKLNIRKQFLNIHKAAKLLLEDIVLRYAPHMPKGDKDFDLYFYNHFRFNAGKGGNGAELIILRPCLMNKDEYLKCKCCDSFGKASIPFKHEGIEKNYTLRDIFSSRLPDNLWVVEISIPELYWINKCKVGDLLLDPELLQEYRQKKEKSLEESLANAVLGLRLPKFIMFKASIASKSEGFAFVGLGDESIYHALTTDFNGALHGIK